MGPPLLCLLLLLMMLVWMHRGGVDQAARSCPPLRGLSLRLAMQAGHRCCAGG
jgi:hypothetical protein